MKINTVLAISIFLILSVLFAICIFFLFMRQNQMARQLDSGIENLKSSIPATKSNPNTVENAEFSKFERDLRDSNNKWLWGWTAFFTAIVAVVLAIIGVALWFSVQSLIADRVGKYITEFKEDVGQLDKVKDQLRMLEYKYTNNLLIRYSRILF